MYHRIFVHCAFESLEMERKGTPDGVEIITYSSKHFLFWLDNNKATLLFSLPKSWEKPRKIKKAYRRSRQMVFVYKIDVLEVGEGVKVEGSDRSHWHWRSRRHRGNTWNTKADALIEMYPIIQYFSTTSSLSLHSLSKHTKAKTNISSKNSPLENLVFHKIHIFKIPIFTKFTFFKASFFTKFTISKCDFSQNSHLSNIEF